MKEVVIDGKEYEVEDFGMADVNDSDTLLKEIDGQLKTFGLELVVGDYGDTNWWVKVVRLEK